MRKVSLRSTQLDRFPQPISYSNPNWINLLTIIPIAINRARELLMTTTHSNKVNMSTRTIMMKKVVSRANKSPKKPQHPLKSSKSLWKKLKILDHLTSGTTRRRRFSHIIITPKPKNHRRMVLLLIKENLVLLQACHRKEVKLWYIDCLNKGLIIKRDIKFEFLKN